MQLKVSFFHPFVGNFFIFLPLGQNPSEAEIQDMVNTVDKVPTAIIYHTLYQCSEAEIQDMVNTGDKVPTAIIYHTLYHCSESEIQDMVNTVDKVPTAIIYHTLYHCSEAEIQDMVNTVDKAHTAIILPLPFCPKENCWLIFKFTTISVTFF